MSNSGLYSEASERDVITAETNDGPKYENKTKHVSPVQKEMINVIF